MRLNRQLVFVFTTICLLTFFEIFLNSCASRSAPSGGPRDTLAPVLDTSFPPNMSLNFKEKEVVMVFNEYIQLKNAAQQISFSPPLKNKPTISQKGKELKIEWSEDTLLENTTYIISFGNSVADFTEGNVNEKIKYVFSTGNYIDSLSLSGTVMDVRTGEAIEKIMVGLYDINTLKNNGDSIPFKNLPTYYAYTDENGQFVLSNMKYSRFLAVAFEDARGNFKMTTGKEKVAFLSDTITTSLDMERITLLAFNPASPDRFYGAKHTGRGQILLPFSYTPPSLQVDFLDSTLKNQFHFISFDDNKDTATLWFNQPERDSITLFIKTDSTAADTAVVQLKAYGESSFTLSPTFKEVKFNEPILFESTSPIKAIYDSLVILTNGKDTLNQGQWQITQNPLVAAYQPSSRPKQYSLYFKQGAVESLFGEKSDSNNFDFTGLAKADLGNLNFTVKADSTYPLVLQFFSPDNEVIADTSFRGQITLKLRFMKAGEYSARLIVDTDGNGQWTTGSYLDMRQPERIIEYIEKAEVRANWDLELDWRPDLSKPQKVKLKESRSLKN